MGGWDCWTPTGQSVPAEGQDGKFFSRVPAYFGLVLGALVGGMGGFSGGGGRAWVGYQENVGGWVVWAQETV